MSHALKAALWSGLLCPGVGQIMLKHYGRGLVFILAFAACLSAFAVEAMRHVSIVLEKMQSDGYVIDVKAIEKAVHSESLLFHLLVFAIMACWIIAILDAYRLGKRKDIEGRSMSRMTGNGENVCG